MQRALQTINRVKLHFLMKKKVSYGLGIYVIGNKDELGHWNILDSLRLNWNTVYYIYYGRMIIGQGLSDYKFNTA